MTSHIPVQGQLLGTTFPVKESLAHSQKELIDQWMILKTRGAITLALKKPRTQFLSQRYMCLIQDSSILGNASENLLRLHKEKSIPPIVDKDDGNGEESKS